MRISVKIFSIALIVFAIMASASFYTLFKLYQINDEMVDISEVFLPLSDQLAHIEIQIVEEELHVERLEKTIEEIALFQAQLEISKTQSTTDDGPTQSDIIAQATGDPDAGRHAVTEKTGHSLEQLKEKLALEFIELEKRSHEVDEALKLSEEVVKQAQERVSTLEERLLLAELFPHLKAIELQHRNYHTNALTLIQAYKFNSPMVAQLEDQLERKEEELSNHMEATWEMVEQFTLNAVLDAKNDERDAFYASIGLTVAAGILALILSLIVVRGLVRPVRDLLASAERVETGDLRFQLEPRSTDEIGALTNSFNSMVDGLRTKEKIKETFGQYVDPRVVSGLLDNHASIGTGEKKLVSVYFSDLADFSSLSEQFTPSGLVRVLNRYLDIMSEPIRNNNGVIDKYIGDAIMAFWSEPFCNEDEQALLAVQSALASASLLDGFKNELPELTGLRQNIPPMAQRIGIATGEAVVGSIGSDTAKNYTVLGDTVNLGSRLESANKIYGTDILVCARTRTMCPNIEFRHIDRIVVAGKTEITDIYEPLGHKNDVPSQTLAARDEFEAGLEAYLDADWARARKAMHQILEQNQTDPVAGVFLQRLDAILDKGVPADWDGAWHLMEK
jgi:class 3 adenylate cyclase